MYSFFRRQLFELEPERAHEITLLALRLGAGLAPARWILQALFWTRPKPVSVFGLNFKNPLGLAAGYDRDGLAVRGLAALGFGHVEIGEVTPLPQPGNPKPRLFRLIEDEALIDHTGCPSRGSAYVQKRLNPGPRGSWLLDMVGAAPQRKPEQNAHSLRRTAGCIIGVNICRNTATRNDQAVLDYLELLQNFAPLADFLTINVGSPDGPGLQAAEAAKAMEEFLTQLHVQRRFEQERLKRRLRLLVKLSPDLTGADLEAAVDVIVRTHMDGIVAGNATQSREGIRSPTAAQDGGLSGPPLRSRCEAMLRHVLQQVAGEIPVVSSGGIAGPDDVKRRLDMGAALVQIHTGLVYRGPELVRQILRSL